MAFYDNGRSPYHGNLQGRYFSDLTLIAFFPSHWERARKTYPCQPPVGLGSLGYTVRPHPDLWRRLYGRTSRRAH
jgi:hypothetical protein